jgi:plasmid stabilization system protein ParE
VSFSVEITAPALAEIEETFAFLANHSLPAAERWYNRLRAAFESLRHEPERCQLAPENDWYDGVLRQLLYGKRRHVYRILFEVREKTVYILRVRHGRQDLLGLDEFSED